MSLGQPQNKRQINHPTHMSIKPENFVKIDLVFYEIFDRKSQFLPIVKKLQSVTL